MNRVFGLLLASALTLLCSGTDGSESQSAADHGPVVIAGVVREAKPTEATVVDGVRIEAVAGELAGPVGWRGSRVQQDGIRRRARRGRAGVARCARRGIAPEPREIVLSRSGVDACADLPAPPEGVPGLREYARLAVHHDGTIVVKAARLPFFGNQGYFHKLTSDGWVRNEVDYVLVRAPVPVRGGFL